MSPEDKPDFYASYGAFKQYATPTLSAKHRRRFDREFWTPMGMRAGLRVLEIGCGTGQLLAYLKEKGIADLIGIDRDPAVVPHLPSAVSAHVRAIDIGQFLDSSAEGGAYDRIFMVDVLEHFTVEEGYLLLRRLAAFLRPGGRVLLRVPNVGSPWGAVNQYDDLTHRAAYAPGSLRQLAIAAGYDFLLAYPHEQGSRRRRLSDRALHALLGWALMTPPRIWTANLYAILGKKPDADGPQ